MPSFLELQKQARYRELCGRLQGALGQPWTWSRVVELLEELGVGDVYGFFAAGWWMPVEAVEDPAEVNRLVGSVERAMAEGRFPSPDQGYRWEHLQELERICGLRPGDVVRRLVWNYALTPGEDVLVGTLERFARRAFGV